MNSVTGFRLINLRCLRDTQEIELRPLTFLVGVNSSGKSTFLRSLPLLRQSVEARTSGPILWYGNYVDFGNFEETISAEANPKEIAFEFSILLEGGTRPSEFGAYYYRSHYPRVRLFQNTSAKFLLAVNQVEEGRTATKRWRINLNDDELELTLSSDGGVNFIKVNGQALASAEDKFHLVPEGKIFQQVSRDDPSEAEEKGWIYDVEPFPMRLGFFEKKLIEALSPYFAKSTSVTSRLRLIASIPVGKKEQMLDALKTFPQTTQFWKKHITALKIDSQEYQTIRNLLLAARLPGLLAVGDRIITSFAREIRYIAPVRATVERYYRAQGLATDEMDAQGKNLAVYLQSLSESQQLAFSKWTEEQIGFSVKVDADGDHLSLRLQEVGSSQEYNMTDMGFGFSQIMPILAQIWSSGISKQHIQRGKSLAGAKVVAIEQPELHLHPRLQARVADLFAASVTHSKTSDVKLNIVAETHSEAMINRLGHLVARGKLDANDVQVVVFNKPDPESRTNVSVATFSPDGRLTNWPLGFFLAEEE